MFLGLFLLLMGALMILDNLGVIYIRIGEYIVPLALIALGASFILDRRKKGA